MVNSTKMHSLQITPKTKTINLNRRIETHFGPAILRDTIDQGFLQGRKPTGLKETSVENIIIL